MSERMRQWAIRGLVVGGIVSLIVLGWSRRDRFVPIAVGDRAPEYAARSLAGDTVSLESLRDRVVVLNVWATWCAPCRWEMPALERLYRRHRDEGLEVVAVSVDAAPGGVDALGNSGGDVRKMVEELGITFTILHDPEGAIRGRFGIAGLPTTFVIDREGRVAERVIGPARWDEPPHADLVRRILEG